VHVGTLCGGTNIKIIVPPQIYRDVIIIDSATMINWVVITISGKGVHSRSMSGQGPDQTQRGTSTDRTNLRSIFIVLFLIALIMDVDVQRATNDFLL
jgi:L-asparagine transporter-like permease